MGQRTSTETLFGIVAAFVERRTWSQADLARRLETRPETIRRRLAELQRAGFAFEREEDHPHVYWSVGRGWFPGAIAFHADEASDLLRLLARAPRGRLRDRVLGVVVSRLTNAGARPSGAFGTLPDAVRAPRIDAEHEAVLATLEDGASRHVSVRLRYFSASRRDESWRHVSVHRIELALRPQFIATCHRTGALRRFRISNVSNAQLDPGEPFRRADAAALTKLEAATFGGYHDSGRVVECTFLVRDPEAAWVARNLPDDRIATAPVQGGGVRFSVETSAVTLLARYVVGLGEAARPETPELRAVVEALAAGALAGARQMNG